MTMMPRPHALQVVRSPVSACAYTKWCGLNYAVYLLRRSLTFCGLSSDFRSPTETPQSQAAQQSATAQQQQQQPPVDRKNSMGWGVGELDQLMQRRSSSLGLSIMNDADLSRRGSLGSLGPALGLDADLPPPHRPLVGGGAAAAYEAARADHYQQKRDEQVRRASSLGLGSLAGNSMPSMGGLGVNPNQHYEMLKLHHMNLLNEIQETTLMMNLYQQQQLQQQQQNLQHQHTGDAGNNDLSMLMQGNDFGRLSQRGSLALGMPDPMQAMRQQQPATSTSAENAETSTPAPAPEAETEAAPSSTLKAEVESELSKTEREKEELEAKLQKLKDDIAQRQKEADELEKGADGGESDKRKAEDGPKAETEEKEAKKPKTEEDTSEGKTTTL